MVAKPQRWEGPRPSTLERARAAMTRHQLLIGSGYVEFSDPLPMGRVAGTSCEVPYGTADGSVHLLKPPTGGDDVLFRWVESEKAFAPQRPVGCRLAFPAAYLASHGWAYAGAYHA